MRWMIGTALTVALVAWYMVYQSQVLMSSPNSTTQFWGNFLLNLSSELFGFSIAALLGLFAAKLIARATFKDLSEPVVELIKELRAWKSISPPAARQCVKIIVKLLSDEQVKPAYRSLHIKSTDDSCGVCALDADVDGNKCRFCGLKKKLWSADETVS